MIDIVIRGSITKHLILDVNHSFIFVTPVERRKKVYNYLMLLLENEIDEPEKIL